MRLNNEKGFSLVEVMISLAIFSFISAGVYSMLFAGNSSWQSQDASVRAQQQVRNAVETMARDLRVADGLSITQSSGNMSAAFTTQDEGAITYAWSTSGSSANQFIRTSPSATRIVARDISLFSVTDSTSNTDVDITSSVASAQGRVVDFRVKRRLAKR